MTEQAKRSIKGSLNRTRGAMKPPMRGRMQDTMGRMYPEKGKFKADTPAGKKRYYLAALEKAAAKHNSRKEA